METVGHILGFVAIGLFVSSYQIKEKNKLLLVQMVACIVMGVQYALIGAFDAVGLYVVCIVRYVLFLYRDRPAFSGLWLPIALSVALAIVGLLMWNGWHTLLMVAGLAGNTMCMGLCDAQNFRKSILFTCPLVLAYNFFAHSYSGMINESLSIVSAALGLWRYRQEKKQHSA